MHMKPSAFFAYIFASLILLGFYSTAMAQDKAALQAAITEARQSLQREDFAKVRTVVNAQLLQNPRNAELYYYLGSSYLTPAIPDEDIESRKRLLAAAKAAFEKGTFYSSKFAYNFVGLGGVYAVTGPYTEVEKNLKLAEELNPTDVELLAAIARFYILANTTESLKSAEVLLLRASSKDPANADISLALGELYFARKRYEQALDYYKEALKKNSQLVRAHYAIGVMAIEEKKYNEGIESLQQAVKLDPAFAPAYRELGEIYNLAGRYPQAIENFRKYLSMTTEKRAQYIFAKSLYSAGQYPQALEQIDIALKDTVTPILLRLRGYSLSELKRYDEALAGMDKYFAAFKGPYISKDYTVLADIYKGQQKDSLAILQLKKALELDPSLVDLNVDIAKIYSQRKQYNDAIVHLERSMVGRQPKPGDYFDLGKAYLAAERYKDADSILKVLAKRSPTFTAAYLYLARANYYLNTKEVDSLHIPYYQKVVEGYKADPAKYKNSLLECYRALGGYYFEKKKYLEAKAFIEKVLELAPSDEVATEQLNYINKLPNGGRG